MLLSYVYNILRNKTLMVFSGKVPAPTRIFCIIIHDNCEYIFIVNRVLGVSPKSFRQEQVKNFICKSRSHRTHFYNFLVSVSTLTVLAIKVFTIILLIRATNLRMEIFKLAAFSVSIFYLIFSKLFKIANQDGHIFTVIYRGT